MNIYENNGFLFLSVCYQQRRARKKDQDSIEKVKQIIAKIDQILVNNYKAKNICFDGVFLNQEMINNFLKRIIFSLSIDRSCARKLFDEFPSSDILSSSIKDEIFGLEISSMECIKKFSKEFGGFDALSLTTFEDLDKYIDSLLDLKKKYKKKEPEELTEQTKLLFPTCYHKSLIEELEFRKWLKSLDLTKEFTIEVNPCDKKFDLEKFIYQTITKVKAYQAQSLAFTCRLKADFKYPSIEKFLTSYLGPSSLNPEQLFGRFVGLKIWDLKHERRLTIDKAITLFTDWYNEKYPKDEISDDSLKQYYEIAKNAILHKNLFRLQNNRRTAAQNKKKIESDPPLLFETKK